MAKRFLVLIALLMLGFYVAGCAEGDDSASVVNPNPSTFVPYGSISGVVMDYCTNTPISGAVVSVAYGGKVHQVTTGTTGAFSFANVPAQECWGDDFDWSGDAYAVTCDLSGDADYGYAWVNYVSVYYSTLEDGTNYDASDNEGGSGANTPVNNLAAVTDFWMADLNASIAGTIYDVTTGRTATAATVALYASMDPIDAYDGMDSNDLYFISSTTTTTGAYSFADVMPGMYYALMVTKAGYQYASIQPAKVGDYDTSCGYIALGCAVGCNQALAGVDVNVWYNPERDLTIPFIASIYADDEEVIDDSAIDYQVQAFVVTFSEVMKQASVASMKSDGAVVLSDSITVTVTATTQGTASTTGIIDDFTLAWASSGTVLRVIPTYLTEAEIIDAVGFDDDDTIGGVDTYTFAYDGEYQISFDEYNPFLTDLSNIPWATDSYGDFVVNPLGAAYQNLFIFWQGNANLEVETEF